MNNLRMTSIVSLLLTTCISLGNALGERPLSWDLSGLFPLNYNGKYSLSDPMIKLLQEGESEIVKSTAIERMSKDGSDLLAAWCYGQAARLKKDGDGMLAALTQSKKVDLNSAAGLYAQIVCHHVRVSKLKESAEMMVLQESLTALAKKVTAKFSDNLPLMVILGYLDGVTPGQQRDMAKAYLEKNPKDPYAKIAYARSQTRGPISYKIGAEGKLTLAQEYLSPFSPSPQNAVPFCLEQLKADPNQPEYQYILAYAYGMLDQKPKALAVCRDLLKNPKASDLLRARAQKYLEVQKIFALVPSVSP